MTFISWTVLNRFNWTFVCCPFSLFRGSAIAKIVGANAKRLPQFEDRVTMYVFEEMIDGKKLTEIINTTHENVKYLPGHKLPENVVSVRLLTGHTPQLQLIFFRILMSCEM